MNTISTKNVQRRSLKFDTIDQCLEELDRIKAAVDDGTLETLGNWTPGQIMAHLAAWIEYGWDGYHMKKKPFFVQWIFRVMMKGMVRKGMSAGFDIPGVEGGTTGQDDMEPNAGIARLKRALQRLKSEPAVHDSPAMGKVSEEFRTAVNLRHAELHLGFIKYPGC
jgi:hypothetical protein